MSRPFTLPSAPTLGDDKSIDSPRDHLPISSTPSVPLTPPLPHPRLSQRKKWALLALLSLGIFIDTWGFAAFFVQTPAIADDLHIRFEQQSWIINSYAVTFTSFLLFWGRVSDLYAAKPVFAFGFLTLGVLSLANSFVPDKISFFVIRALSGVAGAALIPASYRLIVLIFEPHELGKAFATYGLAGGLANSTGLVIAGVMQSIQGSGQTIAWRWFFRLLAALILPFAVGSLYWIPPPPNSPDIPSRWKRLDLVGSISMLLSILLLILGLTLGASDGWRTPQFLIPFLLAFAFLPFFFWWESRIPADSAILPPSVWRIPNITVLNVLSLYYYLWWSIIMISFIEVSVRVNGDSYIIAAVRLVPLSVSSGIITVILVIYPHLISRPRLPITLGILAGLAAYILCILSNGGAGSDYWKLVFPACVLGAGGMIIALLATNVAVMTAVPPEMAGVAGGLLQVAMQVGAVVGLSIQAGLYTVQPGGIGTWANVRAGYLFVIGMGVVWLVGFLVFFKPGKEGKGGGSDSGEELEDGTLSSDPGSR